MTVTVGSIVDGVVTGITNFGAFVRLEDGTVGLVHISEVADSYVKNIADFLAPQDKVKVKVISIADNGKVALSIKQANPPAPKPAPAPQPAEYVRPARTDNSSFEDKLAEFMKDSNDKLLTLKKHQDSRRR